jgi:hypothetical protein
LPPPKEADVTTGTICAGIFFLIGLAIALSGFMTYRKSNQAANWIPTQGKIKRSEVTHTTGGKTQYYAHIEYEYTAQGMNYSSNNVTLAQLMGITDTGQSAAQEKVKKFPIGSTVTVFYDPNDPRRAVLQKGGDSGLLILGGIFIAFAVLILFLQ